MGFAIADAAAPVVGALLAVAVLADAVLADAVPVGDPVAVGVAGALERPKMADTMLPNMLMGSSLACHVSTAIADCGVLSWHDYAPR
jgi:hypothetical protein